jgi:hypothetical protein
MMKVFCWFYLLVKVSLNLHLLALLVPFLSSRCMQQEWHEIVELDYMRYSREIYGAVSCDRRYNKNRKLKKNPAL